MYLDCSLFMLFKKQIKTKVADNWMSHWNSCLLSNYHEFFPIRLVYCRT